MSLRNLQSSSFNFFDQTWQEYLDQYPGELRVERGLLLAQQEKNHKAEIVEDIFKTLLSGKNANKYSRVLTNEKIMESKQKQFDRAVAIKMEQDALAEEKRIDEEIRVALSNVDLESQLRLNREKAELNLKMGKWNEAKNAFKTAEGYFKTNEDGYRGHFDMIRCLVYDKDVNSIMTYTANFSNHQHDMNLDCVRVATSQLIAARGLAALWQRDYKFAAETLIQCHSEIGETFNEFLTSGDIILVAVMCALASFEHSELKGLLEKQNFVRMLDAHGFSKQALMSFLDRDYTLFFKVLSQVKTLALKNYYLSEHVNNLGTHIFQRAILSYLSAYSVVDLKQMSTDFATSLNELENTIHTMVLEGRINAQIDPQNHYLTIRSIDYRNECLSEALIAIQHHLDDIQAQIVHINFRLPQIEAHYKKSQGSKRGGRDMGFGNSGLFNMDP
ncbi:putative COP9 signalosome complex subunit 1b [Blattamonas nauphoetae]|uniref:COP9 signalosome complex subunit 1b n=1 Tax=Blattamonas nauphoetae TaxID=2049346 RepID=A0ABQ9YMH9_9EUKA|nr:putative COP9 signalosome complex subunit 1b [Blattamonas nauphoetae]